MGMTRERIAILGGGVGAMTCAYWLTTVEGWQDRYEIDVYQMGWRLGGKGASGRNADLEQRIEEHGLHIWFGFYDNAFTTMRGIYGELGRAPGAPLATWEDAFKPHDYVCLAESIDDDWRVWPVMMPSRLGQPGDPRPKERIESALASLADRIDAWLHALDDGWRRDGDSARFETASATGDDDPLHQLLALSARFRDALHQRASAAMPVAQVAGRDDELIDFLKRSQILLHTLPAWLGNPETWSDELRRIYLCIDLGLGIAIGMLVDDVLRQGFEAINHIEFRAWLRRHGAWPISVDSAVVRGFYDLVFAYVDGDFSRPDIEAGTMLRGMLKVGFAYRGAIMYKMQAGMGDVVFAPVYELLRRRGVRFHFFHKLMRMLPSADGKSVEALALQQQVELSGADYEPLVDVLGLPCWPDRPLYDQLDARQAALLRNNDVNLESNWSNWPEIHRANFGSELPLRMLRRGVDFDRVVFGLSVASLADVAGDLLARSEPLARCATHVRSVATQAYQVWMNRDLEGVGWVCPADNGQQPVLSGFTEPFDTWAPMDQLLCRETWPPRGEPGNVSYFCNVFPLAEYPSYTVHTFPASCAARVKAAAVRHLETDIGALWSNATAGAFPWSWLIDPHERTGPARFDAQYWRANVDPSERYVMSVTGSSQFRLRADESGFDNLLLAGDWLKTGLDAGCVEAATMGGMQASRAICGAPATIVGESGW